MLHRKKGKIRKNILKENNRKKPKVNASSSNQLLARNNSRYMQITVSDLQHGTSGLTQPKTWETTITFSWYEGGVLFNLLGEGQDSPRQENSLESVKSSNLELWIGTRLPFSWSFLSIWKFHVQKKPKNKQKKNQPKKTNPSWKSWSYSV